MSDSKALAITLPLLTVTTLTAAYFAVEAHKKGLQLVELKEKYIQVQTESIQPSSPPKTSPVITTPTPKPKRRGVATFEKRRVVTPQKPAFSTTNVICSLCTGEGMLPYDKPRKDKKTYACPLCKAQGTLNHKIPTGQGLCGYCNGIGKLPVPPKVDVRDGYHARLCNRCNGNGWRKIRNK